MDNDNMNRLKWDNFEKYVRRQPLARFLARYELFKMQMEIKGSIIECGVHYGGGLCPGLNYLQISNRMHWID